MASGRIIFDEEIEGVDARHVGDQLACREGLDRLGDDDARQKIAERVLLPMDEVARCDAQRIG